MSVHFAQFIDRMYALNFASDKYRVALKKTKVTSRTYESGVINFQPDT